MAQAKQKLASSNFGYYLAAAFGGFLVGFVELVKNGNEAAEQSTTVTVLRISGVLRQHFSAHLATPGIAMLLLAIFGAILCSIYAPTSRKEAFTLGLSVYAVFASITPLEGKKLGEKLPGSQTSYFSLFSTAHAAVPVQTNQVFDYYLDLKDSYGKNRASSGSVLITVYDEAEKNLLKVATGTVNKVMKLQLPRGHYVLILECEDCRRGRIELEVEKPVEATTVTLSKTGIPLAIQRIYRPSPMEVEDVPDKDLERVLKKFSAQATVD